MVAEFDAESETGHQVDDEYRIHLDWITTNDDVHHPADSHEFEESQENMEGNNEGDPKAREHLHRDDNGADGDNDVLPEDTVDVCVLIVVDIVKGVGEYSWCLIFVNLCCEHDRLGDSKAIGELLN